MALYTIRSNAICSTVGYLTRQMEYVAMPKTCHTGLDDRCRDRDGTIRRKNGTTRVDTLREIYGPNFAPDVRGDMKLDTLLDREQADSLSEYLKRR
jgi:hypothetical protein